METTEASVPGLHSNRGDPKWSHAPREPLRCPWYGTWPRGRPGAPEVSRRHAGPEPRHLRTANRHQQNRGTVSRTFTSKHVATLLCFTSYELFYFSMGPFHFSFDRGRGWPKKTDMLPQYGHLTRMDPFCLCEWINGQFHVRNLLCLWEWMTITCTDLFLSLWKDGQFHVRTFCHYERMNVNCW